MATTQIEDVDMGMQAIIDEINAEDGHVDIGVHADESEELLVIAGANEFGATINHPGGTSFGFKTESDARKGKVRFLKKGAGFMSLGTTKAHTITIPARPYIRGYTDANEGEIDEEAKWLYQRIFSGEMSKHEALTQMGQMIEGEIKRFMINLKSPANAKSTIRKKKSANPLIDTGLLVGSIRYVVKPGEG